MTSEHKDLIDLETPQKTVPEKSSVQSAKETIANSKFLYSPPYQTFHEPSLSLTISPQTAAASTMDSIQNHPATQQAKDAIVNGPVGQTVQKESAKTNSEFQDLADSKQTPATPAATGQPLTHYHSFFYRLLSWKNPRATAIVFASVVTLIFAARYLDALRWTFKGLYSVLGCVALGEIVGNATLGSGLASRFRPRQYYTIRKESLERFLDDVEQLTNFVVIEAQRIVFAENIWVTVGAFITSFLGYWLIKWLPLWGITLIATCITFLAPLIYVQNQAFIDEHIHHAGKIINDQASQVRDLATQHTNQATETLRTYAGEYGAKAQQLLNDARGKTSNGSAGNTVKPNQFPSAPKTEPISTKKVEAELAH